MEKSKQLKSKSVTKRKSYGMQLIQKRLKILNDLYHQKHEIIIIDRTKNGEKGTQVDVILSTIQNKFSDHA